MIINPCLDRINKKTCSKEVEKIRKEIAQLPEEEQKLILSGEAEIDKAIKRNKIGRGGSLKDVGLNVFDLRQELPMSVMDTLQRLYLAAGYVNVEVKGPEEHRGRRFPNYMYIQAVLN